VSEEEHLDFLETQLSLIEELGESTYLAQQMHEDS
jgi:bacterioferritin